MESPFTLLVISVITVLFLVVGFTFLTESKDTKEAVEAMSVINYVASVLSEASSSKSGELDLNLTLKEKIDGKRYTLSIVSLKNETIIIVRLENGREYRKRVPVIVNLS